MVPMISQNAQIKLAVAKMINAPLAITKIVVARKMNVLLMGLRTNPSALMKHARLWTESARRAIIKTAIARKNVQI